MKTQIDIHLLVRSETTPHEPDKYLAYCGYEGEAQKEFIDPTRQKIAKVTCDECLEKLRGSVRPVIKQRVAVES